MTRTYRRSRSVGRRVGKLRRFLVAVHVVGALTFFPYFLIFWALSLVIVMLLVWVLGRPHVVGAVAGGVLGVFLGGQAFLWLRSMVPEPNEEFVGFRLLFGGYGLALAIGAVWVLAIALGRVGQARDGLDG